MKASAKKEMARTSQSMVTAASGEIITEPPEGTVAYFLVIAQPGQAIAVAQDLVAKLGPAGVLWADVVMGLYDIVIAARVPDNRTLSMLQGQIQQYPGVDSVDTLVVGVQCAPAGREAHP